MRVNRDAQAKAEKLEEFAANMIHEELTARQSGYDDAADAIQERADDALQWAEHFRQQAEESSQ